MNLSGIFIKRPVMTVLVMLLILFFGVYSYLKLPVSDLPDVQYPTIEVSTSYPGATPETIANNITSPLERQFTAIDGINTMTSTSSTGSSTIVIQFDLNKSLEVAANDVQAYINAALPNLPSDLPQNPTYQKVNPSSTPVLYLAATSDLLTQGDLYNYGYTFIGQRLGMVEGVSKANVIGSPFAVRVQVDPDALSARQISLSGIASTITSGNVELTTGTLYGPATEYTINTDGQVYNAEGYNNLIVRNESGALVSIGDLGHAIDSLQNDKYSLNYYTKDSIAPCILVSIQKQAGANTLNVIKGVKKVLNQLEPQLPGSVKLVTIFDQSQWILEAVDDVKLTLIVAFILVCLVIVFYLGKLIDTVIPVIALPMSIIGTMIFMYILGFNIDILSLLAITLSVGFLIDDAVVVLENINRHIEMGESPWKAALRGSKEISVTVLSMTISLASVFIPLIFLSGILGRVFREFAMTIVIAVLMSGFVSLTLTPMLCSRFMAKHNVEGKKNFLERLSEGFNRSLLSIYAKGLHFVLRHRYSTLLFGVLCVVATIYLGLKLPKDFLPPDDLGFIQGFSQSQDGTSPYLMMRYEKEIGEILQKNENVEDVIGAGGIPEDNQGLMFIRLKPYKERKPMPEVVAELQELFQTHVVGPQTFLRPIPLINLTVGTTTVMGDYQYSMQSFETANLYKQAESALLKVKALPGLTQVTSDMHLGQPQLNISILRNRASFYNVTAQTIETALGYAYGGGRVSTINTPSNQYDVILETIPSAYKDPSVLNKIYLPSTTTTIQTQQFVDLVPLSAITTQTENAGPLQISHVNTLPSVTITFDVPEIPLGTALQELDPITEELEAHNVTTSFQGSASVFLSTFKDLTFLFFISIFVIYIVLGILYESFLHPITVLSALPPAILGALGSLLVFGEALSLYAFVGLTMLIGIVLKNGIIMIDFAIERMREGMDVLEAAATASKTRFRPILMTTFAAMMGAVPIALGIGGSTAQSRKSLGIAIVGGLIISQLITLFLTPVIFVTFEKMHLFFSTPNKHQFKKSGDF